MAMIRGRYAPSPTGRLHLGNLRTALVAWLQARLDNGVFILRVDDLDTPRNRTGSLEKIIEDLRWLGIDWDEGPDRAGPVGPYLQSGRLGNYQQYFSRLQENNLVYRCYCSRKDIVTAQSAPHGNGISQVYPGTCRPGSQPPGQPPESSLPTALKRSGEHAWRFIVGKQITHFPDQVLGQQDQHLETEAGDFVLLRKDRQFSYQLACAVDDCEMGITDVVRGADLVGSTHWQITLMNALGLKPPRYWHIPLMLDDKGERMSKRDGSESLDQWRNEGKSAAELVGYFSWTLGLIDRNHPVTARELEQELDTGTLLSRLKALVRTESQQPG